MAIKNIGLMDLAGGAVMEQLNIEAQKIAENIRNPNTDPKVARTLTVKFTFKADDTRDIISVTAQAKATVAPYKPIAASLFAKDTPDGVVVREIGKGVDPNQVTIEEVAAEPLQDNVRPIGAAGRRA